MKTIVLAGGLVIDGTGQEPFVGSVSMREGLIVDVRRGVATETVDNAEVIDCSGLLVAPGFVDIHCHSDLTALEYPANTSRVSQGIATEVVGNCGMSPAPTGGDVAGLRSFIGTIDPGVDVAWNWSDIGSWIDRLRGADRTTDIATHLGHGSAHFAVVGGRTSPLDRKERAALASLIDDAMDAGCVGVSLGLMYAPGELADPAELEAVGRAVARRDGVLSVHMRSYSVDGLFDSVREMVSLSERTGCRTQISHLRMVGFGNGFEDVVGFLDNARRTVDIAADAYPYTAGHTNLIQLFPPEIRSLGASAITARLIAEPAAMRGELARSESSPDDIVLMKVPSAPELAGRRAADLAADPWAALVDLLIDNECIVDVAVEGSFDHDLDLTYATPWIMVASDGMGLDPTHVASIPHPRSYGAFPRAFGRMRALGRSRAEAIHRMTMGPARRVGLDVGRLVAGGAANVVVLDEETFTDRADYTNPSALTTGISSVYVNGTEVVTAGAVNPGRPGRFIPRHPHRADH
jgi:N-acyl-D-amino-acid deacylase